MKKGATGFVDCSDMLDPCDLNANADAICTGGTMFEVSINIQGTGTYRITSSLGEQTGLSAGDFTIGSILVCQL